MVRINLRRCVECARMLTPSERTEAGDHKVRCRNREACAKRKEKQKEAASC